MARREEETGLGSARVLDADEVQGVLSGSFYAADVRTLERSERADDHLGVRRLERSERDAPRATRPSAGPKPAHYKVICISLYTKDLEHLDALVDELKVRGLTKANRSALIRVALDQLDLDKVPRGM